MSAASTGAAPQAPAAPGLAVTATILLMASMTIMANATISSSLPGLRAHFAGLPDIETLSGLLLTLPSLAIVLTAGLWGVAVDRMDRQALLVVSALLYAAGGTSGLWAQDFWTMLAGRAVLGLGVAGTMTLAMTWGVDLFHGPARARFLGRQGAAMSAGGVIVSLLGGALAAAHWRGAFGVYLLVLPIMALGLMVLAPHARAHRAAAAARGAARAGGAPGAFPWRAFLLVGPLGFFFMATFYVIPTRMPFHLAGMGVESPLLIGVVMAGMTLSSLPGALAYGRIRRHLSAMAVFALSFGLMGAGMLVVAVATTPGLALAGTLLMGIGMGPAMPNYTAHLMAEVPPDQRGRASGMLTTAFFAGQFASPLVSAPLVGAFGLVGAFEILAAAMIALALVLAGAAVGARRLATG